MLVAPRRAGSRGGRGRATARSGSRRGPRVGGQVGAGEQPVEQPAGEDGHREERRRGHVGHQLGELLHRCLAEECTPEERAHFEAWRDASSERQALVASLLQATGESLALPLFTERDRVGTWARLEQNMRVGDCSGGGSLVRSRASRPRSVVVAARIAAAAVLWSEAPQLAGCSRRLVKRGG